MKKQLPPQRFQFQPPLFLICGLLVALTAGVYAPMLWHDFINYDDPGYVTDNAEVQKGVTLESFRWALAPNQSNWHPLTWLSLMLDYQLSGGKPWLFKLTNLLLHAANTVLLFLILRRMTQAAVCSVFVAVLFAIHPLHAESVAWITERKDVLSTFFWMLTWWFYAVYVRRPSLWRYGVVLLCFAIGLMAKSMLVTLPFTLLLIDMWPLCRCSMFPCFLPTGRSVPSAHDCPSFAKTIPALIVEKIPFFLLAAASSVITFLAQKWGGSVVPEEAYPFLLRLQNSVVSTLTYLGKTLWPTKLAVFYLHPGPTISTPLAILSGLILIGVTAAVIWQRKKRPFLAVGWFWYLGTLIPVIGLVQVGMQSMADRYTYIPLIGIFIMLAWGAAELIRSWRPPRLVVICAAGLPIILLAVLTHRQLSFWKDSVTLHTHAIAVTKNNPIAHSNLADAFKLRHDYQKAVEHYAAAMAMYPDSADDHCNIADLYIKLGRQNEAAFHAGKAVLCYDKMLQIKPDSPSALNGKGAALAQLRRHEEACVLFQKAVSVAPANASYHHNFALSLAQINRFDEAIEQFQLALRYARRSSIAEYTANLANVFLLKDDYAAAVKYYRQALDADPDYSPAHSNLNSALILSGQPDEALANARQYAADHPANPDALNVLGTTLLNLSHFAEAADVFTKVLQLDPNYFQAKQSLLSAQKGMKNP